MRMLTPSEAKFFFRATCIRQPEYPLSEPERETFEYYLPSNDTTEALKEIETEGWLVLGYSCTPMS